MWVYRMELISQEEISDLKILARRTSKLKHLWVIRNWSSGKN